MCAFCVAVSRFANGIRLSVLLCMVRTEQMPAEFKLPYIHPRMYLSQFSELAHIRPADCVSKYLNSANLNCVLLLRPCLW